MSAIPDRKRYFYICRIYKAQFEKDLLLSVVTSQHPKHIESKS